MEDDGTVDDFELEFTNRNGEYLWERENRGNLKMLNVDMALVSDMAGNMDSVTGLASCVPNPGNGDTLPACPAASTLAQVQLYANSNQLWLEDFRDAFVKMCNTSSGNLTQVLSESATEVGRTAESDSDTSVNGAISVEETSGASLRSTATVVVGAAICFFAFTL